MNGLKVGAIVTGLSGRDRTSNFGHRQFGGQLMLWTSAQPILDETSVLEANELNLAKNSPVIKKRRFSIGSRP